MTEGEDPQEFSAWHDEKKTKIVEKTLLKKTTILFCCVFFLFVCVDVLYTPGNPAAPGERPQETTQVLGENVVTDRWWR